jgi:hypothetical protein
MPNIQATVRGCNDGPGIRLNLVRIDNKQLSIVFTIENVLDGVHGIGNIVSVPLSRAPRSRSARRRAIRWARQRVLDVLNDRGASI